MYDLIIIGGGPAGVAAGIYAARKKIKTALITDIFGGQSAVSMGVENFIGIKTISGFDLAQKLEEHLRVYEEKNGDDGIKITTNTKVLNISLSESDIFGVETESGEKIEAKTILITAGSLHRKLGILGEEKFNGHGVAYCATCDAPFFKDKRVAVVGGGNSALEGVRDIIPHASEVYLFVRDKIKGDKVTLEKISKNPKVKILLKAEIDEIIGGDSVEKIKYHLSDMGEKKEMPIDGVFVEIGWKANSAILGGLVDLNEGGEVVVDHKTQKTSLKGIWAAGDITDMPYKQNNISMGDAVKAVLNINDYLQGK